jgi:hypothetical protein
MFYQNKTRFSKGLYKFGKRLCLHNTKIDIGFSTNPFKIRGYIL